MTDKEIEERMNLVAAGLRMNLVVYYPFYGYVLNKLCDIKWDDYVCSTACTDGKNIWFNHEFVDEMTDGEIRFVIMHEMLHVVLLHRLRFEESKDEKDHEVWNEACDAIVNYELYSQRDVLRGNNINITVRDDAILLTEMNKIRDLSDKTVEEIYYEMIKDREKNGGGGSKTNEMKAFDDEGNSSGSNEKQNAGMSEDVTGKIPNDKSGSGGMSQSETNELKNSVRQIIEEARTKGWSLGSSGVARSLSRQLERTKIRWDRYLRKFLSERISEESSWDTPNRKYLPYDVIMPGSGGTEKALGEVWIFIDTSGSIIDQDLEKMINNAWTICEEYHSTLNLGLWHSKLYFVEKDVEFDDIKGVLGRIEIEMGGTDVSSVFNFVEKERLNSTVYVIMTDGEFNIPNVKKSIVRKTVIGLLDTKDYNRRLDTIGKIVSIK